MNKKAILLVALVAAILAIALVMNWQDEAPTEPTASNIIEQQ